MIDIRSRIVSLGRTQITRRAFAAMSVVVIALVLPSIAAASPITINFSTGTTGNLSTSTFTDSVTGITVRAYYSTNSGSSWSAANLYRRNETGDHGFGVAGGKHSKEVDNSSSRAEILRVGLPAGYQWVSVRLSSLDTSERMKVYGDDNGVPGTVGNIGSTVLGNATIAQVIGVSTEEPTVAISTVYQRVPYLFLEPYDWSGGGSYNNDFLLYKAKIERVPVVSQIPEPASMILVGSGLAGLVARRRQRHQSASK